MAGNIGEPHWLSEEAKIRCGSMTTSQASGCMPPACQSADVSGHRSPDRQPLTRSRQAGDYLTSARRTARSPRASGIQSQTSVVTPSCCQYSAVIVSSKSRVMA